MSGGSWNYCHEQIENIAKDLLNHKDPLRKALGRKMELIAKALHDIEWVDSGDYDPGREIEAIKKALGDYKLPVLAELVEEAKEIKTQIEDFLKEL